MATLILLAGANGLQQKDVEILQSIAQCESQSRHVTDSGELLRGAVHPPDVGYFQINESVHAGKARELELDLHTLPGNILFAIYLYKQNGTTPWNVSKYCWG